MKRDNDLFNKRNEAVNNYVDELCKKNPHWRYAYVIQKASEKFFLSIRTITCIVNGYGAYKEKKTTLSKQLKLAC